MRSLDPGARGLLAAVVVAFASSALTLDLPEIKRRGMVRVIVAADEAPETLSVLGRTR